MLRTATPSDLSAIDNVAAGYVHRDKLIEPGEGLALKGAWLKWYDIALPEMPVPAEIRDLARAFVAREAAGPKMNLAGELGFVILHRCTAAFYFLLVCSWRHENEIWKSTFAKDGGDPDFKEFTFATSGNSARSGMSSRPGSATSARRETMRRSWLISATATAARCSGWFFQKGGANTALTSWRLAIVESSHVQRLHPAPPPRRRYHRSRRLAALPSPAHERRPLPLGHPGAGAPGPP